MTRSAPAVLALITLLTAGCQEYVAPPEVALDLGGERVAAAGEPVNLTFTKAVDVETVGLRLWPRERGLRRVPTSPDVEPLAPTCMVSAGECESMSVTFNEEGTEALVAIAPEFARPGSSLILEVVEGLSDSEGFDTGVGTFFNVQFGLSGGNPDANIAFQNGVYILGGSLSVSGLNAVLTLVSDLRVKPDGRFALAGAKGVVDTERADKTSLDPEVITIADDDQSWALFARGTVVEDDQGTRFLTTESFNVSVPVLGVATVELKDVVLYAEIIKDDEGNDFFDGTLTFGDSEVVFPNNAVAIPAGEAALAGGLVPEELVPEGTPDMCTDICGAVTGQCTPPGGFPDLDFCEEVPSEE
ncbi:hypothetical protein DL240_17395 [Lujinxingia litoralis]|uniref:Uncharacterized protein n=2 Tax=Lujinxingia litoralis TaxID=2211119 RepID=A0A328C193_9DELT|nr:hypothetical protein DL240_17395 [Lujinxingia litoralis]